MPDIFDEVEEDLRAERAQAIGRRYGVLGVLAAVLIVAGTGGYVWWQQKASERAQSVAGRFIAAATTADAATGGLGGTDKAKAADAAKTLSDISATGPAGYQTLARLRLAAVQWNLNQTKQALATWQSVTDDSAAPQMLRDLATLTSAQHQVDSAEPAVLKQTLETLTAPGNHWAPMAEQVIAMLDLRMGKTREAAVIIQRLTTDPQAPSGIREMATDLLTTLPPDATAPAPHLPTSPAAPVTPPGKPASHG